MQSLTHTNITNRLMIIARGEKALDDENNDEEMITWKKIIKKVTGGGRYIHTSIGGIMVFSHSTLLPDFLHKKYVEETKDN